MNKLYGAILGDIVGKKYEYKNSLKLPEAKLIEMHPKDSSISDDSIMTLASARSILYHTNIEHEYKYWGNKYKEFGFGKGFLEWIKTPPGTTNDSWANGCIMRISPYFWRTPIMGINSKGSVTTSHNHKDSIEAARILEDLYFRGVLDIPNKPVAWKNFEVAALPTIEFVKSIFYHTSSTKEAIQLAVSLGGDTDTTASIVGELSNYHRSILSQ